MIDRFGIHSAYLYMSLWKLTDSIFFFNDTATTEIYTLSLHDALPISIRLLRPDQLAALAAERTKQTAERPKPPPKATLAARSEEHTSELQSRLHLVCRLLLEKKKITSFIPCQHKTQTSQPSDTSITIT